MSGFFLPRPASMRQNHSRTVLLLAVLALAFLITDCELLHERPGLLIARRDRSRYRIVVAEDASPSTFHGAFELQHFLHRMTGAQLPLVSDRMPPGDYEIVIGNTTRLERLAPDIDFKELGDEGYVIRTVGRHLVIAGGDLRGNMYGVYGLLEEYLGCRWFTPDVSRIPHYKTLHLPPIHETTIPALEYREPYTWEAFDGDWAARNRMNRNSKNGGLGLRHGGRIEWVPDMFVHTFEKLVPAEKYFRKHPEYFSLVDGRRRGDKSQLCCTNEEVIRLATEGVLRALRENPQAQVISVSQNDRDNHCECPTCQALAEREESQAAPVLDLVNRVAEAVEEEFPDVVVETLAYQWTRIPPKTMRPRHNVAVRLCSIECDFSRPLNGEGSDENTAFANDLRAWAKVSDRLWIWNYVTSFAHYFIPFPNLRVRDDNIRFFVNNNVKGVFQQDVYTTCCGEFSSLSAYLNAKLLWNPSYNGETAITEFLEGVYGGAAEPIREYLDLLHDRVEKENIHLGIWEGPDARYLSDDILARADSLWETAEAAVREEPEVLKRVRIARLSTDYASIWRDVLHGGAFLVDQDGLSLTVDPSFTARLDRFCHIASNAGTSRLKEYGYTVDEFRDEIEDRVSPRPLKLIEPFESAQREPGLNYRFYEGAWTSLPLFDSLNPSASGSVAHFEIPFAGDNGSCGYTLTGYLTVPRDGVYTFTTISDGYSELSIAATRVVQNTGTGAIRERAGFIALGAGTLPVTLTYFTEEGCTLLDVLFAGPGIEKQEIPPSALSRVAE